MKNFYMRYGPKVFPPMRFKSLRRVSSDALYDPKPLEDVLLKNFGDVKLKECLTHLVIATTDIKRFKPVWIKSFKGQKDTSKEGWGSMLLREAVRATTSAPTYFPARYVETTPDENMPHVKQRHSLIDGQFFAGNAPHRMYAMAKKIAPPDAEIVVVHVGTGDVENRLTPEEFNKLGVLGLVSKAQGSILMSLAFNMAAEDSRANMREELGNKYFSFDGILGVNNNGGNGMPTNSLDDASPENMKNLLKFGDDMVKNHDADIDRLCSILKRKAFMEQSHTASRSAFQKICDALDEKKTVKSVTALYKKVLRYSTDLADKPEPGDEKLLAAAKQLTSAHKEDLDRYYNTLLDSRKSQNSTLNALRTFSDNIRDALSKATKPAPPTSNDNTSPDDKKKPPAPPPSAA